MNPETARQADDIFYERHKADKSLFDSTGKRRPLTMDKADEALRKEWLAIYDDVKKVRLAGLAACDVGGVIGPCAPPSPYDTVDASKDVETYNCAGLAHRTYTFIGDVDEVKKLLAAGTKIDCAKTCPPGQVQHWLWEYDVYIEDEDGNTMGGPSHDFHTVAGQVGSDGKPPTNVNSKNGKRPLEGPGTGPDFKPKARDEARYNDKKAEIARDPKGRPIYKARKSMVQTCYCMPPP